MKHKHTKQPIFGALFGAALVAGSAQAALVVYNPGDLLVGFRDVTGTKSVVVNLGSAASFRDDSLGFAVGSPVTLSLGDINTDLVATFGGSWASNSNMRWGIVGSPSNTATVGGDIATTVYASKAETTTGTVGTGFLLNNTNRGVASTTMMGLEGSTNGFNTYQASSNNTGLVIQNNADPADWASFQPGGNNSTASTGFKVINGGIEGSLTQTLDLFRTSAANSTSYVASFSLSGGSVSVIPEPSSLLVAGLGLGALAIRRRRI